MGNPVHIFLADDDNDDRLLFYEAIRLSGIEAELSTANNGIELLELLQEVQTTLPRVIFLDLNMPMKNGHECLTIIRKDESLKTIPVIIYSTSVNPEDVDKSFEEGADFYIRKPESFNDLVQMVKGVLSLNRYIHMPPTKESFVIQAH